ncbi:MAG TPA: PAS domain S-box protein [Nocardioidaceae bacterium]|nr:PAS domain S-box protein [Nocardioidaceae bacterium]
MMPDDSTGFSAQEILDAAGQAVIVTDVAGVVTYWNAAAEALYGWTAEEAKGRLIEELTVSGAGQQTSADIMQAIRDGVPWSGSFPVRHKDGYVFPALVSDAGIYKDGKLLGIVGVSTNLGVALRPLLERSTDAALVLRSDAVITYASPAVQQLFGWEDSVVGTSVVPLLHPDERPALARFLEEVVAQPGAHPALELRLLSETGWVWAEAAVTNMLDDPDVRGLVCNLRRSIRREAHETAEMRVEQLNTALRSRVLIEQAKGYLAAKHGITPDEGFNRLRNYSRNRHIVIHEVSRLVVEGELDLVV